MIVLVRGDLPKLVLTSNLGRLVGLEGCLSGNKPEGQAAPGGPGSPCDRLAETKPVQVVYGPGTFVNAAAGEINDQIQVQMQTKAGEAQRAARAARRSRAPRASRPPSRSGWPSRRASSSTRSSSATCCRPTCATGSGLTQLPSIDNSEFVSALVFDALARGRDAEGALRLPVPARRGRR